MTGPNVSVIIPTRDRCHRLALALRSACWQRGVAVDVIVVDDGSTDATSRFLRDLNDPRIRGIRNEVPSGPSHARNRGVAVARSEWVAFLDDDDLWAPDKLHRQLDATASSGRRWAYGGEVIIDEQLRVLDGSPPHSPEKVVADLERYDALPGGSSGVLVARNLIDRVGLFDPGLRTSEDWDMWIRLAREGLPACVPRPLVALSLRRRNSRAMQTMLRELHVIERRHDLRIDWPRHYRWAGWEALRDRRRWDAARYYITAGLRGDVGSIPRAAMALAWPDVAQRRLRRGGGSETWKGQAAAWINELARGVGRDPQTS